MLVAPEAVYVWVEMVMQTRQPMEVLAKMPFGADSSGEEETKIGALDPVAASIA